MAALEEAIIKRVLPHSVEAEQSVIGSMMIDREAIVVASEVITGEDFYNKQYGVVFETMVELHEGGKPVDLVTLQDKLKEKDVPSEVSSLEFIRDIITAVPTYGYTTVREHLASSCRVIMERSAAYYVEKAKDISPDCGIAVCMAADM